MPPYEAERVWAELPERLRARIRALNIQLYCIDGDRVAEQNGMGNRINTIMQTCFFALAGVLPRDEAIALIKESIEKSYARKGPRWSSVTSRRWTIPWLTSARW